MCLVPHVRQIVWRQFVALRRLEVGIISAQVRPSLSPSSSRLFAFHRSLQKALQGRGGGFDPFPPAPFEAPRLFPKNSQLNTNILSPWWGFWPEKVHFFIQWLEKRWKIDVSWNWAAFYDSCCKPENYVFHLKII